MFLHRGQLVTVVDGDTRFECVVTKDTPHQWPVQTVPTVDANSPVGRLFVMIGQLEPKIAALMLGQQ